MHEIIFFFFEKRNDRKRIQRFKYFEKGGDALYVGHHGWPAKKLLDFRWSKKAEITLETISFWQNIYISIFKFSPFLSIKSYQFSKFTNTLIKKKKKNTHRAVRTS